MSRICILMIGLMLAGSLSGCMYWFEPQPDAQMAPELSKLRYPTDATLGPDLDILVAVNGGTMSLTNRTAHTYANRQLWLNQQYVGLVDKVAIGTENHFDLTQFINLHGECYPIGTFLQPENAFPLVLAELYDPVTKVRQRLVARVTGL